MNERPTPGERGALLVILAGALALRVWGLTYGLPHPQARPDEDTLLGLLFGFDTGDLNPRWFIYPTFFLYLLYAYVKIVVVVGHALGVVSGPVELADLMPTALRWAGEILECAPLSIRASKQASLMGLGHPLDIALNVTYPEAERMRRSEDTVEGPRAFAEKRKPVWKAR